MARPAAPADTDTEQQSYPPPRANPLLIGQEAAEQRLLDGWRRDRLAHAWLLTGPAGIGKATLAYRFARFVLAASSQEAADRPPAEMGGLALPATHPVFRRVAAQGHPDLRVAERPYDESKGRLKTEIPIDSIRDLGQFLHHTSAAGGWRVAIVDGVEAMNRSAQNALLKALEEPPERTLLLLVCARPHAVLPTIRSRCQSLPMPALSRDALDSWLIEQRPDLPGDQRRLLIGLAQGSPGQALNLAEVDGVKLCRDLITLLSDLPRLDWRRIHELAERLAQRGQETRYEAACFLLNAWVQRLVRAIATGDHTGTLSDAETALVDRLATGTAGGERDQVLDRWLALWDKIRTLFRETDQAYLDHRQSLLIAFHALEQAADARTGSDRRR